MVCGDAVRKIAMITAADNFDHIVQTDKAEKHKVRQALAFGVMFIVFGP